MLITRTGPIAGESVSTSSSSSEVSEDDQENRYNEEDGENGSEGLALSKNPKRDLSRKWFSQNAGYGMVNLLKQSCPVRLSLGHLKHLHC